MSIILHKNNKCLFLFNNTLTISMSLLSNFVIMLISNVVNVKSYVPDPWVKKESEKTIPF